MCSISWSLLYSQGYASIPQSNFRIRPCLEKSLILACYTFPNSSSRQPLVYFLSYRFADSGHFILMGSYTIWSFCDWLLLLSILFSRFIHIVACKVYPGGSDGKESTCSVGDLGSIPGLGRSPGEFGLYLTPVFWPGEFHGLCSPWVAKNRT